MKNGKKQVNLIKKIKKLNLFDIFSDADSKKKSMYMLIGVGKGGFGDHYYTLGLNGDVGVLYEDFNVIPINTNGSKKLFIKTIFEEKLGVNIKHIEEDIRKNES